MFDSSDMEEEVVLLEPDLLKGSHWRNARGSHKQNTPHTAGLDIRAALTGMSFWKRFRDSMDETPD
jgi:hypothetical protein